MTVHPRKGVIWHIYLLIFLPFEWAMEKINDYRNKLFLYIVSPLQQTISSKFKLHVVCAKSPTWYIIYPVCCLILSRFFFSPNSNHNKNLLRNIIFCIRQGHLECIKEQSKKNSFNNDNTIKKESQSKGRWLCRNSGLLKNPLKKKKERVL